MIYWKLHAWTEEYISAFVSWYQVSSVRFPVWTKTEDNRVRLAICLQIKQIGMSIIASLSVSWLLSLCFCLCVFVFVFLSLCYCLCVFVFVIVGLLLALADRNVDGCGVQEGRHSVLSQLSWAFSANRAICKICPISLLSGERFCDRVDWPFVDQGQAFFA